jgi:hypothetical protein
VQCAQLWSGLHTDLNDEDFARVPVGRQRLGLASGAVQREHALRVEPLGQRVRRHERIELADELAMPAGRQAALDGNLGRAQPQILQPANLRGGERLVCDVGERGSAPQRERVTCERVGPAIRVHGLGDEALETPGVDALVAHA